MKNTTPILALMAASLLLSASLASAQYRRDRGSYQGRGSDRSSYPYPSRGDTGSFDRYAVILSRNIFARDRKSLEPGGPPQTQPAPITPEQAYVLTGIVKREDGGGYYAFVEDANTATTTKITVGSAISQGKVTQIDFNSIQYVGKDKPVHVSIGQNLNGGTGAQVADASSGFGRGDRGSGGRDYRGGGYGSSGYSGGGNSAPPSGGSTASGSTASRTSGGTSGASAADIEAMMRARRARETGGR